jgi:hypothetical protein
VDHDDPDPIESSRGRDPYLQHGRREGAEKTVPSHRDRTNHSLRGAAEMER